MELVIEGTARTFIPIRQFRETHGLNESFSVMYFEPKDYEGLGHMDGAGEGLNQLRRTVLHMIPLHLTAADLLPLTDRLRDVFARQLEAINPQIGLHPPEVEFAIAGFTDVCQALVWRLMRHSVHQPPLLFPLFESIYLEWLNSTVRISQRVYLFIHEAQEWQIQIVNHAFGRAGLIIYTPFRIYYVDDHHLACPAQRFMESLLEEVYRHLTTALLNS